MLKNPSNPLLNQAAAPAPGAQPSAKSPVATESASTSEQEEGDDDEEEESEEDPASPGTQPLAEPEPSGSAATQKPKLSAFDRGLLRGLGKGDLIARVERSELEAAELTEQVANLKAENTRLAGELSALKNETPAKIEAAAKGRENQVAKGVAAELSALGITPEAAPAAIAADSKQSATNRQEALQQYAQLQGKEKREFYLKNRNLLV
jgi:hypothetical protein